MNYKRIGSLLGAGALIYLGMRRASLAGYALAGIGAALAVKSLRARVAPQNPTENVSDTDLEKRPDPPDIDKVDEAGFESFPASDPPAHR
jgi:uncharacterized membrane protein